MINDGPQSRLYWSQVRGGREREKEGKICFGWRNSVRPPPLSAPLDKDRGGIEPPPSPLTQSVLFDLQEIILFLEQLTQSGVQLIVYSSLGSKLRR